MGRPSVWNSRKIDTAISLYGSGFPLATIAKACEVTLSTAHRLLSRTWSASIPSCVSPAQRLAIMHAQERREEALKALGGQVMPVDLSSGYKGQVEALERELISH